MEAKPGLLLLGEPGEPLGVYLRAALTEAGLLGDGSAGLVLPRLTGQLICRVYAGVYEGDETARQTAGALLAGRRVWCPREGLCDLGRGPLERLVRERLWTLRRSGLVLCPLGELAALAGGGRERGYGTGPGKGLRLVHEKIR